MTKVDIDVDHILLVEGYIRNKKQWKIPQDVQDLILFFYAKPKVLQLKNWGKVERIIYCHLRDGWYDIRRKIASKVLREVHGLIYENKLIYNEQEWNSLEWDQDKIFETEHEIRYKWKTGDMCQIYSNTNKQWFQGVIVQIFHDEEGEWIEVRYHRSMSKQVQRYSTDIRPYLAAQ